MRPASALPFLAAGLAGAAAILPQAPLNAPLASTSAQSSFTFPSVHESAVMARRMLHLEGSGTLASVFPSDEGHAASRPAGALQGRPPRVARLPFALPEYIADCEPRTGNPTVLQIDIATNFRNAAAGSNLTLSVSWHPPGKAEDEYSAAELPRFALFGWLEEMSFGDGGEEEDIKNCFLQRHPDVIWTPGSDIHTSRWTRFVVEEFYWFGGFGDRARIEWIDPEEWRGVTLKEIEATRLPGEESP